MDKPKLRLGILLDSFYLPAWAFRSLERVVNLECADVAVIIVNGLKDSNKYRSGLFYKKNHSIAIRLIDRVDSAIFLKGLDAFAPKNSQELFSNVPVIRIKPTSAGESGCFSQADIAEIKSYQLDILIRMGFDDLRGDILTSAKFGIWTYDHGGQRGISSDLPGFWEVVNLVPETSALLYRMKNNSTFGKVLYKSSVQTFIFSPARNLNRSVWLASSFLPRQVELLYQLGEREFFAEIEKYSHDLDDLGRCQYRDFSNFKVLVGYFKVLIRIIREIILRTFYLEHWYLLFDIQSSSLSPPFQSFKEMLPPRCCFWADPHIVQHEHKYYIFIEEYIYKESKGRISVIMMDQDGTYQGTTQILSKDYHLSYPFVFEWDDKYYMIPETSENKSIELYECVKFPIEWKFKMNLMENVCAVDTTLFYNQENWWLFTGMTENEGASPMVELFLFYSKDLLSGSWTSHPLNPIITDVKKARPAGRIFSDGEKIYRPSQDQSRMDQWGFSLNEILILSEANYLEKNMIAIRPTWNKKIQSVHTFSKVGSLSVIDACKRMRKI